MHFPKRNGTNYKGNLTRRTSDQMMNLYYIMVTRGLNEGDGDDERDRATTRTPTRISRDSV